MDALLNLNRDLLKAPSFLYQRKSDNQINRSSKSVKKMSGTDASFGEDEEGEDSGESLRVFSSSDHCNLFWPGEFPRAMETHLFEK
jgi:hypothetical protein